MEQCPPLSPRFSRRLGRPGLKSVIGARRKDSRYVYADTLGFKRLVVDFEGNVSLLQPSFDLRYSNETASRYLMSFLWPAEDLGKYDSINKRQAISSPSQCS